MNQFNFPLLVILGASLLSACATKPVTPQSKKIAQNTQVTQNEWKYLKSFNHEQKNPGSGYSEKYSAPFGWADVYEYDLGKQSWQDGVGDPLFNAHFRQIVREVYFLERIRAFQNVKFSHVQDEIINDVTLRHAVLHYQLKGKNVESHIYLSGVQGQLLKFRITLRLPLKPGEKESMARFVQQMVDKTLNKKRNKRTPNRIPKPDTQNPEITL